MVDALFSDRYLASLYDRLSVDRGDERFYVDLVMSGHAVLDVGCGTGALLHRARESGHTGRLCGLDPAAAMLEQARRHPGIEWVQGTLPEAGFAAEFDLVVMTGHAFQVLTRDEEVRTFLTAAHRALTEGGHLAFETRNPLVRGWEAWTPDDVTEIVDDDGAPVRVWHDVEAVDGELVTFTETFDSPAWDRPQVSRSTLRFLPAEAVDARLGQAGFAVAERYGDWDRSLMTPSSREIVTVARRSPSA
jgi:ubiquinone/menaquinone biosynthesis C-methylase UbiE